MINGIIIINKEKGYTSNDVVCRLRGILRQKRIGHTGTLDPEAVGVLPVCLGNATRLCGLLTDHDKEYVALLRLGVTTDTQDMTGRVLKERPVPQDEELIRQAVRAYEGEYDQLPPMYSALKVRGKKLYEYARQGIEVERIPRTVKIRRILVEQIALPTLTLRVNCSKGTYIRTLCHDIGERLGCGGAMAELERTRVGQFTLEQAVNLEQVERLQAQGELEERLISTDALFPQEARAFPSSPQALKRLTNGNPLAPGDLTVFPGETVTPRLRIYDKEKHFMALYRFDAGSSLWRPEKMFLP